MKETSEFLAFSDFRPQTSDLGPQTSKILFRVEKSSSTHYNHKKILHESAYIRKELTT